MFGLVLGHSYLSYFLLFQSYHFIRANMQNNSLYCWRHAFVSLHHYLKLLLLLSCRDYNNLYLPINYSAMDGTLQVFAFSEDHGHSSISILSVLLFYMNMLFFLLMCWHSLLLELTEGKWRLKAMFFLHQLRICNMLLP